MKRIRYFFPAFIWGIFILGVVLTPGNFIPHIRTFSDWLQWDKITHLILFGIFSFFLLRGFAKVCVFVIPQKHYLITLIISIFYGGCTEYLQYILNIGRDGNIYDFYANTIGAILGCLLFFKPKLRNRKKEQTLPPKI
ncbi:MAG: VanZ family protein [Bacteroidales bacterium]|jgi:VanZ family protein|nr:VanZ family protein [Bacteroidales bacterium]